ncbi:MAG: putative rRNA methylase YqxC with S4 and FtsJ domains [Glaciecola sp.]|jgi:predicted rRNA methylase YqxC with S4 and FtsJ domains
MESKVPIVCCDMPDANNLTIGIMAILAEAERISQDKKKALAVLKEKGVELGKNNITQEGVLKNASIRKEEAKVEKLVTQTTLFLFKVTSENHLSIPATPIDIVRNY